jgi:hypothetical protein
MRDVQKIGAYWYVIADGPRVVAGPFTNAREARSRA